MFLDDRKVTLCEVVKAYKGKTDDELTLVPGMTLKVTDQSDKDWWVGMVEGVTAKTFTMSPVKAGRFPASHVQALSLPVVDLPIKEEEEEEGELRKRDRVYVFMFV